MNASEPHPLPAGFGWDDSGEPVPVVHPPAGLGDACPCCRRSYAPAEPDAADLDAERQETIRRLLDRLAGSGSLRQIGWRCALAAWLVDPAETQAQLARRLGVTPAAVSLALNGLRIELGQCLRANGDAGGGARLISPTLV